MSETIERPATKIADRIRSAAAAHVAYVAAKRQVHEGNTL